MEQKQKSNLNILDRAISFISPRAGLERLAWRNAQRSYDAGRTDRLNAGWNPVNAPAESMNQSQRDLLRARARDLERNADISEAVIQAFERNVVGLGMKVQAKPLKKDGTEDEELAQKMEDIFFDMVDGVVEALEFSVPEDAPFVGVPLRDLKLNNALKKCKKWLFAEWLLTAAFLRLYLKTLIQKAVFSLCCSFERLTKLTETNFLIN